MITAALVLAAAAAGAVPTGPEGRLLVAHAGEKTLHVIEWPARALAATVPLGAGPHQVAASTDGRTAWVVNGGDRSVTIVDLAIGRTVKTVRHAQLDGPRGLAPTSDGRWVLIAAEESRRLFILDAEHGGIARAATTVQPGPRHVALARGGKRAWIGHPGPGALSLVAIPGLRVVRTMVLGAAPEGLAASADGRWVMAALPEEHQVALVDARGAGFEERFPAGREPVDVAFAPPSPLAVVAGRGSDEMTVIDLAARRVKGSVAVGAAPASVAVDPSGRAAFVACSGSDEVWVVSLPDLEVLARLAVGRGPDDVAYAPVPAVPRRKREGGKRGAS